MVEEIRAMVTHEPKNMTLENFEYPTEIKKGDFVAKLIMCGICGTDHHFWWGNMPNLPWPVIQGHEIVAKIHDIDKDTAKNVEVWGSILEEGDRVIWGGAVPCGDCWYCRRLANNYRASLCESGQPYKLDGATYMWGGFSDFIYAKNKKVYKIPDDIPDKIAVLTDTLASVWGIDRALSGIPVAGEGLFWGDTAVVQGSGPIGIMASLKLREYNVSKLIMVGGPEWRLREAEKFGVDHTINIDEITKPEDRIKEVTRLTGGRGADLVVEGTGVPAAFPEGIEMVRRGGIFVELGHYTDAGNVWINPFRICWKDLTLISQYGFGFQQYGTALSQLIKWYRNEEYPLEDLITHTFALERTEQGIKEHRSWKTFKCIVVP